MKKYAGLMDFIFGEKEVRVLKKLSKEIISKLKRNRAIHDVDLSIDSEGLIEGSLFIYEIRYDVFSLINKQGSDFLSLNFMTNDFSKPFKFVDQILIQEPDPLRMLYIGVEPTYEPNLEAVPHLVNRIVNTGVNRHRKELKQQERDRSNQARLDREERKRVRRKEYFSRIKNSSRNTNFFSMLLTIQRVIDSISDVYVTSAELENEFKAFLESAGFEPRHTTFSKVQIKKTMFSLTVRSTVDGLPFNFKINIKPDGCLVFKNV